MPSSNVCSNKAEARKLFSEMPLRDSSSKSSMFIMPIRCLWTAKLSSCKASCEKDFQLGYDARGAGPFTIQWLTKARMSALEKRIRCTLGGRTGAQRVFRAQDFSFQDRKSTRLNSSHPS